MVDGLDRVLADVEADHAIRALVLKGRGEVFCVGMDLACLDRGFRDHGYFRRFLERLNTVFLRMETLPVPVVTAVNGLAPAGRSEIILASDLAIPAAEARIGDHHTQLEAVAELVHRCVETRRRGSPMPFAPRPHVELVHVLDMPAKDLKLPGAEKPARLITLSESSQNRAISAVLDLPAGWRRERGANPDTFVEHYLLSGDLRVGGLQLLPHHYYRAEAATAAGPWESTHGARVLYFTEGDPLAWRAVREEGDDINEGITWVDTNTMPWGDIF